MRELRQKRALVTVFNEVDGRGGAHEGPAWSGRPVLLARIALPWPSDC